MTTSPSQVLPLAADFVLPANLAGYDFVALPVSASIAPPPGYVIVTDGSLRILLPIGSGLAAGPADPANPVFTNADPPAASHAAQAAAQPHADPGQANRAAAQPHAEKTGAHGAYALAVWGFPSSVRAAWHVRSARSDMHIDMMQVG